MDSIDQRERILSRILLYCRRERDKSGLVDIKWIKVVNLLKV